MDSLIDLEPYASGDKSEIEFQIRRDGEDEENSFWEAKVSEVAPIRSADYQDVRGLQNEGWEYFAVVEFTTGLGSGRSELFENEDGEVYWGELRGDELEIIRQVAIVGEAE
ncbi:hypothetical protein [Salarchaeum sp. JOR-1]|uniref:hypothetical protein n=1 Tax=Salarchaeum sp. JOR-1 TaxID=2599399 RepID=UPI0011983093|nr:hypothetical protein [Salarchaeum sp. JOR-1]QDX40534.1 hypothetical protein FQU85_06330 [Salarchaeum sp. JOR-1]